jgi:hypothetical protein
MRKLLILIGSIFLGILFCFNICQAGSAKALHIKINTDNNTLWCFQGCDLICDNNTFDARGGEGSGCPIFLHKEIEGKNDHAMIIWVGFGQTVHATGTSIDNEVSYWACLDGKSEGCKIHNSEFNTDALDVAKEPFEVVGNSKCPPKSSNCDCSLSNSLSKDVWEYRPKYDLHCTENGWEWCEGNEKFPHKGCVNGTCQLVYHCGIDECATDTECIGRGGGGIVPGVGGPGGGIIQIQNPLAATSFEALVDNLISFLTVLALVLVPVIIIIGAYFIMTAGGDPEKVAKGKNIIIYSLIALVIMLIAKSLVGIIKEIFKVE